MGRNKELSTCVLCGDETAAHTRIEWQGQWIPVCNKHRMRIVRYGKSKTIRWFWTEESAIRRLVQLVFVEGLSQRKAALRMGRTSANGTTRALRWFRQALLEQREGQRMTLADIADYWDLPTAVVKAQLVVAGEERDERGNGG